MTGGQITELPAAVEDAYVTYLHDRQQLTVDEASAVWAARSNLVRQDEGLHKLFFLIERLASECARGLRCSVCGRYGNQSCSWEC